MRKLIMYLILVLLTMGLVTAGSINDSIKNTQTPYLGEKGGFDSLFVNPAGMAGQTEAFTFSLFGSVTVPPDLGDTVELAQKVADEVDAGSLTTETAVELATIMTENLDYATLQSTLLVGTSLAAYATAQDLLDYLATSPDLSADVATLTTNFNSNESYALTAFDDVAQVYGTGSVKMGTLLKGLGLSLYHSEGVTFALGNRGIKSLATESGLQGGYGLKLGPLSVGASANLGLWTLHEDIDLSANPDIMTAPMGYAYSYGVDVGAQFTLLPGLTFGAVINNLLGSSPVDSSDYTTTTLEALLDGNAIGIEKDYVFSTDLDVGVTWAPDWPGWFRPMLSADYYDFVSLFTSDTELTLEEALAHLRLGASLHLAIFDFGAQYYNNYFTLGAGLDLAFFQLYLEATANQEMSDLGGSVLVKLQF